MINQTPTTMNDFDFYVVKAFSTSIRSLMKVGNIERKSIKSTTDWSGRFPKVNYSVYIGFVDVMGIGHSEASKRATELLTTLPATNGVLYHIECITRD